MKKIFLFAALAGIVFASCSKEGPETPVQNEGQQEIALAPLSKAMTKGVLGSGAFATDRKIQVAGTMKSGDKYVDFLEVTEFAKVTDKSYWAATVPVYYPIGGQNSDFRFLAYSETTPGGTDKTEATFARWYGSNEVELQVSDCAKNEIVYSGFEGNKTAATGAPATFARTQALVTVQIKATEGSIAEQPKTDIIVNKIGFKDVKTSGTLLLKYNAAAESTDANKATHQWLYNAGCNCAFAEMGNFNLGGAHDASPWAVTADASTPIDITFTDLNNTNGLGSKLSTTGYVLDRLFPAQKLETKKMVINYTLGDLTTDVELDLKASGTTVSPGGDVIWAAGKRYVYIITVNVNEILIAPQSLEAWDITTITGQYDSDPS